MRHTSSPQRDQQLISLSLGLLALILGLASVVAQRQDRELLHTASATELSPSPAASISPTPSGQPITATTKLPILMYHYIRVNPDPNDTVGAGLSVSPTVFAKQLAELKAAGYTAITFQDLNKPLPAKPIILTFDDGYDDAFSAALPALQKEGMTGVFYIVSAFLDKDRYTTSEQVKTLSAAGMEIGSHTINHRDLSKMGESDQEAQLAESKKTLEALIGKPVTSFCYPAGKYNETTVNLATKVGYTTSTTTKPGIATGQDLTDSPHELKRIRVTENTDLLKVLGEKE